MTNEYMWELMQRELDDDLSSEEQQLLYSSLQKDPDLQLMYDRLKRVSDQLEQLPPVTPAFSIVDSILPRLEAASLQPAAVADSTPTELPRLELKTSISTPERPKWKRLPVWMARAGSGIVAACLLVGLFFVVNSPKQNGPDIRNQGGIVTPESTPAPTVTVPTKPEQEPQKLDPSSDEPAKPRTTDPAQPKNKQGQSNKKSVNQAKPKPANPVKSKPAVTAPPVEEKKPSFPFGTEIKPGKDDKPDKEESTDDKKDKAKDEDKDEKKRDDRDDPQHDENDEDEDDEENHQNLHKNKRT